jgi:hypothetical protein
MNDTYLRGLLKILLYYLPGLIAALVMLQTPDFTAIRAGDW